MSNENEKSKNLPLKQDWLNAKDKLNKCLAATKLSSLSLSSRSEL